MARLKTLVQTVALSVPLSTLAQNDPAPVDLRQFQDQVVPILEQRCFECHSHRTGKMKNGLTLDSRAGWATGGDSGPAIVAGDPDKSLLIKAIRYTDPDLKMPPKQKLPEAEILALEEGVRHGAPDPRITAPVAPVQEYRTDWWSLKPLVRPTIPPGANHPIDAFVLSKLREQGLVAAPEADRRTLIRRLTVDLHGLLPSAREVEEFAQQTGDQAYESLVDRLLESPRYGERWARHWLDTVHFADTHGFEHDLMRTNAWRYRDYVIESLNQDTAWPRFIREQLAADAFFPDEPRLTVALGFIGAGPWDQSTAQTAPKNFEYLDRDDIVTQTMSTFVSSTVNCARCHDHKFDPIPQTDYYAVQAVFAGVGRGDLLFDADATRARERSRWKELLAATARPDRKALLTPENSAWIDAWEASHQTGVEWTTVEPDLFLTSSGATLRKVEGGALVAEGPRPETDVYTLEVTSPLAQISAIRLEVLPDSTLPKNGPGRQDNGNLHLSEVAVQVFRPGAVQGEKVSIRQATADFNQSEWTIAQAIDGNEKTAWGIHPREGEAHTAVFELKERLAITNGVRLVMQLKQLHGQGHLIGKFRLALTDAAAESTAVVPFDVAEVRRTPSAQRTEDQRATLAAYVLRVVAEAKLASLPPPSRVFGAGPVFEAVAEGGFYKPWPEPKGVRVLKRGDINQPGAEAVAGALTAVGAMPSRFTSLETKDEAGRRRALADWLADERNPLTWRSIVNRVWHYHFGVGLADTLNDFGRMGSLPSHPELLDWLACEFRDSGGSLKALHRRIVTSAAYRRGNDFDAAAAARDPDNRLLWRRQSQRLDAETFRDSVLQITGTLDLAMGGPGVQQFKLGKPIQITPTVDYTPFDWNSRSGARRSIYRFVYRGLPDPFMDALDFPDAAQLAPVRLFSASPLQTLALLNNDFVLNFSQRLAQRLEEVGSSAEQRIAAAFRLTFQREPTATERAEFCSFAQEHGWAAVGRVLFNSNEFLFID